MQAGRGRRRRVNRQPPPRPAQSSTGRSRPNPYDRNTPVATTPGLHDGHRESGSFADNKASSDAGMAVILHGWFTRSGPILIVHGDNDCGVLVRDADDEWFAGSDDNCRSGERLRPSSGLIGRTSSAPVPA